MICPKCGRAMELLEDCMIPIDEDECIYIGDVYYCGVCGVIVEKQ